MSRHMVRGRQLSRDTEHRKALRRNMVQSLFEHGKIRTTLPKAKEVRAFAERLITLARTNNLTNRRRVIQLMNDRRLTDEDPAVHFPAAVAWDRYETACSTLLPRADAMPQLGDAAGALAIARIEAHYFVNNAFLEDGQLLANIARVRQLPCTIVQGRYDVVCPIETAYELSQAWPEAEMIVVADAGHSVREPGVARELVAAVERMKARASTQ